MNRLMLVVMLPLLVGPAFAGNDLSTISDPNAKLRPADPNAPFCVESPVPPSPVTDQAPPFGTVVRQWDLGMSGSYAGAGITWRRDSGRFYLIAQGRQMWSVDPANPPGTARQERWVFPNMGSGTLDIPWSLAWDNDSGCFWISNVVDGNIYGGCYYTRIRKSDVGDTWRWVPTNPGDTWLVGTGTAGGAGSMYWMAGSEKWLDRGIFACAPVAPSPGTNNYVWKFEPYSKQSRGRCPNGHMTSERGCGLVPWDSNYILTTGWNANTHYKRDSTGLALQSQPATVYGPADNAVWVPQIIGPDDTVFMYTICSNPTNTLQKISVGMRWNQLPSINPFNVRPLSILAPTGTIDSGQTIFPKLVIRNMSNEPADDVSAWFMIDDGTAFPYLDSAKNLYLDMRTTCTLQFSAWMPQGRDSMGVVAWTYWAGDSFPQDDTIRNRFLVRVKDIAVTQIIDPAPDTTLDSGVVFNPRARVWNYGNVSVNFDCRFTIGRYRSTRNLNLIAGGATIVMAPNPYTANPGIWSCIVNALVVGDLHPENNVRADTFTVRGEIYRDVEAIAVLSPPSVVDTTTLITPRGLITNNGVGAAAFKSFFIIQNAAGTPVYADSANHMLGPGDTAEVAYKDVWLNNIGIYYAAESVSMDDDQKSINDVKRIRVRVVSKLSGDIGVLRITSPAGNIKADSTFTPAAIWKNYSDEAAPYDAFFFFHNKYGARVYGSMIPGLTLSPNSE
ncbi:hypothetical protein FJY70_01080, partial [candidate division WOR-3 bacterium]|nr:hypothetical protein [candidate division WOR-3 bacterium]